MPSTSANRGLTIPTNLGDVGVWGTENNASLTGIDTILGGQAVLASSVYGAATTLSSALAQNAVIQTTGAAAAHFTLTFDSTKYGLGSFLVYNAFSSSYSVYCISTASSSVSIAIIPPGQVQRIFSWGTAITSENDGGTF